MSMLAFPPGLLRSPPIDPRTGLWSRPWLEYWQAQYDRIGGENAPTNIDLDDLITSLQLELQVDSPSYAASIAMVGTIQQSLSSLQREVANMQAVQAQLMTLAQHLASMQRVDAMQPATQAIHGRQEMQLEQLSRQDAREVTLSPRLAALAQRVESLERLVALNA